MLASFLLYAALEAGAQSATAAPAAYQTGRFPDLSFDHIGRAAGISNLAVSSIVQDQYGYLWFGTQGGVNRYDGQGFTVFEHDPFDETSLSHNLVQTLFLDKDDILWAGTYLGLNRIDTKTGSITKYYSEPSTPDSLSNDIVVSIYRDNTDTLWVGTLDGLNRMKQDSSGFIRYPTDPIKPGGIHQKIIRDIHQDRSGRLWIATQGGLHLYERGTDTFLWYPHEAADPRSIKSNDVMSIAEDTDGVLWFATWEGISRYREDTNDFEHIVFPDNRIYTISAPDGPWIYAGSWGGGLYVIDRRSGAWQSYTRTPTSPRSLSHNTVYSLYQDRSGLLWVGTNGGGVNSYNPQRGRFRSVYHDPRQEGSIGPGKITSMLEDSKGRLWMGTYNGGLNRRNRGETRWKTYTNNQGPNSLANDIVTEIFEDSQGAIWIGTNYGINRYRDDTDDFELMFADKGMDADSPYRIVYSILEDKQGRLWFGSYTQGVYSWDRNTDIWQYYVADPGGSDKAGSSAVVAKGLTDNLVFQLLDDGKGGIWIATNKGLNHLDPDTGIIKRWFHDSKDRNSLGANTVRVLYRDSRGRLWLGLNGGGLDRYDEATDRFIHHTKRQGMSHNTVLSILEDAEGKLWMGTQEGLTVFNPETDQYWNYTDEDGLQDTEFSSGALMTTPGVMLFGGVRGYSIVDNTTTVIGGMVPPVHIGTLSIFNEAKPLRFPLSLEKEITLHHDENYLSFTFSVLDFAITRKNTYAWILEGFDQDWVYATGKQTVSYTNLPAGQYVFRVKGASAAGIWNQTGDSVKLNVMPHPALSWWAIGLYIAGGIIVLAALVRLRAAMIIRKRYEDLKIIKGKLEAANSRLSFLSTHDELTGLPNRRYMNQRLQQEWDRARRERFPVSVLMIDVDFFKAFNDRYGHLKGDEALTKVAILMQSYLKRGTDIIGRYGGEEFLVILGSTGVENGRTVAEALRSAVAEACFEHADGVRDNIMTVSIGTATMIPEPQDETQTIIARADAALYAAKSGGRDLVVTFEELSVRPPGGSVGEKSE